MGVRFESDRASPYSNFGLAPSFSETSAKPRIKFEGGLFPGYALVPVRRVDAVKLAQERRPGQRPACLRRHGLGLLLGSSKDARIDWHELPAAGLSAHLDHARSLEGVEQQESIRHVLGNGDQAVIAQHEVVLIAEVAHQPRLFVFTQRHA